MSSYEEDRIVSDNYKEQIRLIIKQCAPNLIDISVSSEEEDNNRATDYIIVVKGTTIGCRIRKGIGFFERFHDFTIRTSRPSGSKTELEKIKDGIPRWYLYGWGDGTTIPTWIFVDMDVFRENVIDIPDIKDRQNYDGTKFNGYDIDTLFKYDCILQSSPSVLRKPK